MLSRIKWIAHVLFPRTNAKHVRPVPGILFRLEQLETRDVPSAVPNHYWKLDESAEITNGAVADSGNAEVLNPATASNFGEGSGPSDEIPILPVENVASRKFDGADDKLVTDANVNLSGSELTMAAWVRVTDFSSGSANISSVIGIEEFNEANVTNTALLRIGDFGMSNKRAQFVLDIGNTQVKLTGSELVSGYWYHIAGVYDGVKMKLYINGQLNVEAAQTGAAIANGKFYMGSSSFGADRALKGSLDDIKLYTKALTAIEIAEVVTETTPITAGKAIWPVKIRTSGPAPIPINEEHEILNGFGSFTKSNKYKFHEGIDIIASGLGGEKVVAARPGTVVLSVGGLAGSGGNVTIKVQMPGMAAPEYDTYLHVMKIQVPTGTAVSQGQAIGFISNLYYKDAIDDRKPADGSHHLHYQVETLEPLNNGDASETEYLNPFNRFESDADRDPFLLKPDLEDTNDDGKKFLFVEDGKLTDPLVGLLKGNIDLIADLRDQMHPLAGLGANPLAMGYYVRPISSTKSHGVKSSSENAYILARFDDNWFPGSPANKRDSVYAAADDYLIANPTKFQLNLSYILTNTKGTDGNVANVDSSQYWNTNAKERAIAPNDDDTKANYATDTDATNNGEARFKDGNYLVHVVMADQLHDIGQTLPIVDKTIVRVRLDNFEQKALPGKGPMNPAPGGVPMNSNDPDDTPYSSDFTPTPTIGIVNSVFNRGDMVGIKGSEYYPNELMFAYILPHRMSGWQEGDDLAGNAIHTSVVLSDSMGSVPLTSSGWTVTGTDGTIYDIVIDYDNDGKFSWTMDGISSFIVSVPVPKDDTFTIHQSAPLSTLGSVLANDVAGTSPLKGYLDTPASKGTTFTFASYGASVRYKPQAGSIAANGTITNGFTGVDTFTYNLKQGTYTSPDATGTIVVQNAAPVAVKHDQYFATGKNVSFHVDKSELVGSDDATDADNDVLGPATVSMTHTNVSFATEKGGTVWLNWITGFSYSPPSSSFQGWDSFEYRLWDKAAFTTPVTVHIAVGSAPTPIVHASDFGVSVAFDSSVSGNVLPHDAALNAGVSIAGMSLLVQAQHGTATVNADGSYTYTADEGYSGMDSFLYRITDSQGVTATAVVTLTIG